MARTSATGPRWQALCKTVLAECDYVCQLRIPDVCIGTATTVDHLIPASLWPEGRYLRSNLAGACRPCNRRKSNKLTGWRTPRDEINPYSL